VSVLLYRLFNHAIEGNFEATIFNPVASNQSKMVDVHTSEVDAKLVPVIMRPRNFPANIFKTRKIYKKTIFVKKKAKNKTVKGGFKIEFFLCKVKLVCYAMQALRGRVV
jgi:hypothetical protein